MRKYIIISLLSIGWYVFWLGPFFTGTISCMKDGYDYTCFNGGGESIMWYSDNNYAPTHLAVTILAPLGNFNEHFAVEDIANPPIIITGIAFGFATYWLLTKFIHFLRRQKARD